MVLQIEWSWATFTVDPFPNQALVQVRVIQGHHLTGDIVITVSFTSPLMNFEDQLDSATDGTRNTLYLIAEVDYMKFTIQLM